ncbi:type II secretion system protein GspM [Oceanicoccus sp. KOV_DT_Chl]|uniref:type II secretion system protein GspM n=1 Tax=Oceanicoccus sp. KOV_DT_Chl TaxID=1904639 RepID=UPI000C7B730A|nr:type II secretion system protein M [Oceanicoccus sp. KOV_DT_Chl]
MFEALQQLPLYQQLNSKYQGLASRDQLALKLLSAFAFILLLVYGLLLPASEYRTNAEQHYLSSVDTLAWMQANKQLVSATSQRAASRDPGQSLLGIANTTSKNFNLSFKRYQPEGDNGLSLWLNNVAFNDVVLWLERLDQRYGISVKEISVDREEAKGTVNVRLVLQG